mmetsp:Transcript_55041/g.146924  ORF Transcript_55041/g.146924 Transcript_55041/m.146924 type:complete len:201 (-) Transcript_55041:757-1359(-)
MLAVASQESSVSDGADRAATSPMKICIEGLSGMSTITSHFSAVPASSHYSPGFLLLAAACDSVKQEAVSILAGKALTSDIRRTSPEASVFHTLRSKTPDSECSTTDGELCVTSSRDSLADDASSMLGGQWVPDSVLPTGSQGHSLGLCKPCAFFHKPEGCRQMSACPFCHLCDPDEKRRRKFAKLRAMNTSRVFRKWTGT